MRTVVLFRFAALGVATILCYPSAAGAAPVAAPGAAPVAAPIASPATSGACEVPATIGPAEAYAHVIDDPRTLALFSSAENLTGKDRDRVLGHIRSGMPADARAEIEAALQHDCVFPEIAYRTTRLVYMLALRWNGEDAMALQTAARFAIASLALGERVSVKTRDETLALFDTTVAQLDARLASAGTMPVTAGAVKTQTTLCRSVDAKATNAITPNYPAGAGSENIGGHVNVLVTLDAHGLVKTVTLYKSDLPDRPLSEDLVAAAIMAAGASDFAAGFVDCKPVGGSFLFDEEFDPKPVPDRS